jgi:recombination protein RecA
VAQAEYADWKASLFGNINVSRSTNAKGAVFYDAQPLAELADLRDAVYLSDGKVLNHDYLKQLTPLSLALWYMDDATFTLRSKGVQEGTRGGSGRVEICVQAIETTSRVRLQEYLRDTWGIDAKLTRRGKRQMHYLVFSRDETDKLQELVAPYIHPSMDYKLLPRFRGRFEVERVFAPVRFVPTPMQILRIDERQAPRDDDHRYDIEVEGTHNYFADGVMVHNSPETTPGGRALKFYSSVRLDVRRIETLKDGTDAVGNRVRVKVVKNKCVAAGTRVFDPTTGLTHRIEEIVDQGVGAATWAVDKRGELHLRPITGRFDQGEQEVIGLRLRDGTTLDVTPDHRILTEHGWRQAGELEPGDRIARPRKVGGFGDAEPVSPDHARILGYLIGDGYVGGKTPISFINVEESLHEDAARIADGLGCDVRRTHDGMHAHFSHRTGEKNRLLELTRWAGIWGHLAPDKRIAAAFFDQEVSAEVVSNLLFGIWESDGWISREQSGGLRLGFATTSEQLARQIHWLLLRWGIWSAVKVHQPGSRRSLVEGRRIQGKLPCWQVRVSGIDNVQRFAEAIPMWGPKGQRLTEALADPALAKHRGARTLYLADAQTEPVVAHLENLGVTPSLAASLIGLTAEHARGGLRVVLGPSRLRRDRVEALAEALEDDFLREVLADDLFYDRIHEITPARWEQTYDIEVDELHNFVADGVVVHNCASPFKLAEFDILYGEGISREGSLLDVGVDTEIVRKAGAWYTYEGEQLGQGRENARTFLKENPDIANEIAKRVREELGIDPITSVEEAEAVADEDEE